MATKSGPVLAALLILATTAFSASGCVPWVDEDEEAVVVDEDEEEDDDDGD
jgi:hypothetical protein